MPRPRRTHPPKEPAHATGSARGNRSPSLTALLPRLTERDLWLLHMLLEHTVLTTPQITALAYTGQRSTNRRLTALRELGLIDAFHPHRATGSHPAHHVLGPRGAALLAARYATTPTALGWSPELATRTSYSPFLAHNRGVGDFFTRLAAHTRTHPGDGALTLWWSEKRCEHQWGDLARPDAYGHWQGPDGQSVAFFLEYDTGSYAATRVAAKLDDYAEAAHATRARPLVLFTVHSQRREQSLRERLAAHPALGQVAVATTARDLVSTPGGDHDPARPAWLPIAAPCGRVRLHELPTAWPTSHRPDPAPPPDQDTRARGLPGADRDPLYVPAPPPLPPA
ncbi:hypothetical protein ABIA33_007352 [Streptacidiphilus sp. MAP12-16]|uniref:replication-relaxation family protein n=1 Tax=Streptacidiphilus sp. MAP12-16 TaxID=3156300 RepID=UPI003515D266